MASEGLAHQALKIGFSGASVFGALKGGLSKVVEFDLHEEGADGGPIFAALKTFDQAVEELGDAGNAGLGVGQILSVGILDADAFGDSFDPQGALIDAAAEIVESVAMAAEAAEQLRIGELLEIGAGF